MEVLLLLAAVFILVVFPATSLCFCVGSLLNRPPSVKRMVRYVEREQRRELDALDAAHLDHDEKELVRRAIKAKYMRQLRQLYFPADDGDRRYH